MTVALEDDIWTDPSDGYTIRVARFPYSVDTEDGEHLMGFSFHTGALWCEIPGQDNHGKRPKEIHIGPLVKTHTQFLAALLERGFGPDTHYLLGRRRGGFPLRVGSRPAVEALLAELKTEWQEYRRASNPEYRIEGLRAIRRARAARNSAKLGALRKRYPRAAAYERSERLTRAKHRASSVLGSIQAAPKKSSMAARVVVGRVTTGSRYAEFVDGHLKGSIGAGASLAAVAQIGVVGGPAGLALLVGLSAGILANRATERVSVVQIGQFVAERAAVAATETKRLADRYVRTAEASSGNRLG